MRLGRTRGQRRTRTWANGIGEERGKLVPKDTGGESVSPSPSYSFTDNNRESACSSALCWTLNVIFSVRSREGLCLVGTADLSEKWNGESAMTLFQLDRKEP